MKICTCCKEELSQDMFNKNRSRKDGLNNICRDCSRERSKKYYTDNKEIHIKNITARKNKVIQENKARVHRIKSRARCHFCTETDPVCLDFHHLYDKKFEVSRALGTGYGWGVIREEIEKCVIVCANCHRKLHAGKLEIIRS
jgi:hypothetical protein